MSKQRIDEFLPMLLAARTDVDALIELGRAEVRYIEAAFRTPGSRKSTLSDYRRAVRAMVQLSDAERKAVLAVLRLSRADQALLKTEYEADVYTRRDELRKLDDVENHIAIAKRLMFSNSYMDMSLGLGAVTGRRVSEIGVTAHFTRVDDEHVHFTGQLKTREADSTELTRSGYVIPVLAPAADVVATMNRVRRMRPGNAAPPDAAPHEIVALCEAYNSRVSTDLGRRCKKAFGKEWKPKDLRAAYAEIAFAMAGDDSGAKDIRFSQMLGHSVNDNLTGMRYVVFQITDPKYRWVSRAAETKAAQAK